MKASLKDSDGAVKDFNKVIELDPANSNAYLYRGYAKTELGDKNGGCLDLSKAGEFGHRDAYDLIEKLCN